MTTLEIEAAVDIRIGRDGSVHTPPGVGELGTVNPEALRELLVLAYERGQEDSPVEQEAWDEGFDAGLEAGRAKRERART